AGRGFGGARIAAASPVTTISRPMGGPRTTKAGSPTYRRIWTCRDRRQQSSVPVGTIFEDSKTPPSQRLLTLHIMDTTENVLAAYLLHSALGIAGRSAWFTAHRIRDATAREPLASKLHRERHGDRERPEPGLRQAGARLCQPPDRCPL